MCKISPVPGVTHCVVIVKIIFASLLLDSHIFCLVGLAFILKTLTAKNQNICLYGAVAQM